MAAAALKPVAIVGLSAEMPSGTTATHNLNHEEFFKFLLAHQDAYEVVPADRFNIESWHGSTEGKIRAKEACFLKDITMFDHLEFGVSSKDAKGMSVSTRKLIEHAFLALLDSGVDYRGRNVGCYTTGTDFEITSVADPDELEAQGSLAGIPSMIANKISYHLDLTGPSIPVDTACSASLVALHLAIQGLRTGDCDAAVVGGAQINTRFIDFVNYSAAGVLAPDGKSKPFDASADGLARGEGVCVVVVKLLEDAIRDKDYIYATVLNTGVNTSGNAAPVSAPVAEAQVDAMRRAFKGTGRSPDQVSFAELHATGTALGDPTEANWVGAHMGSSTDEFLIGSVKGNIGHLEVTAFMASLSKACSILEHEVIPPNVHLRRLNPRIKWQEYNLKVVQEPTPLPRRNNLSPLVSIMGSGIGGVNGHCLLEPAPPSVPHDDSDSGKRPRILLVAGALSSRSATSLVQDISHLVESGATDLQKLSVVSGRRSRQMTWRTFSVVSANSTDLPKFPAPVLIPRTPPSIGYIFAGQGPQHILMGRQLFANYPTFRDSILRMDSLYESVTGHSLVRRYGLFVDPAGAEVTPLGLFWPIAIILPAMAMLQMALYDLLISLGAPRPQVLIGYSAGETPMLYAAGAISQSMALEISIARGIAVSFVEGNGTMAALGASVEEATSIIEETRKVFPDDCLSIACYNADDAVTLAGTTRAIDHALSLGTQRQYFARKVRTSVPIHSELMEGCKEQFQGLLGAVWNKYSAETPVMVRGDAQVYSTCTGKLMEGPITAEYFWNATRYPVQFTTVLRAVKSTTSSFATIEISPHPVLNSYIIASGVPDSSTLCPMQRPRQPVDLDEDKWLLDCLGRLALLGYAPDFFELNPSVRQAPHRKEVPLPAYPFSKKDIPYLPTRSSMVSKMFEERKGPLCYSDLRINAHTHPELVDHVIMGKPIMPAGGYIEMAFEAGARVVWNAHFSAMMPVYEDKTLDVNFRLDGYKFSVESKLEGSSTTASTSAPRLHAGGYMSTTPLQVEYPPLDITAIMARCQSLPLSGFYKALSYFAQYGSDYQRVVSLFKGKNEVLVRVKGLNHESDQNGYCIHPSIMDACLHTIIHPLVTMNADRSSYHLPSSMGLGIRHATEFKPTDDLYSLLTLRKWTPDSIAWDCVLTNMKGERLFTLLNFVISRHGRELLSSPVDVKYEILDVPWIDPLTDKTVNINAEDGIFGKPHVDSAAPRVVPKGNIFSFSRGSEVSLFKQLESLRSAGASSAWITAIVGSTFPAARGFARVLRNEMEPFPVNLVGFHPKWEEERQLEIISVLANTTGSPYESVVTAEGEVLYPELVSLPESTSGLRTSTTLSTQHRISEHDVSVQPIHTLTLPLDDASQLSAFVGHSTTNKLPNGIVGKSSQVRIGISISSGPLSKQVVVHQGQTVQLTPWSTPTVVARVGLGYCLIGHALGTGVLKHPERLASKRILVVDEQDDASQAVLDTFAFLHISHETLTPEDTKTLILPDSPAYDIIISNSRGPTAQLLQSIAGESTRVILCHEVLGSLRSCVAVDPWIVSDLLGHLASAPLPEAGGATNGTVALSDVDAGSSSTLFSPSKSYLLIGGVGLVGMYLAEWMYENGARSIILTSRSGRASIARPHMTPTLTTLAYLETLPDLDLRLIASDASDKKSTQTLIDQLPLPLGGCFLAALALSNKLMVNHTQESYDVTFASKVGALNTLASVVDISSLEFLISLSSVATWGSVGQANYASANTAVDEALKDYPNAFSIVVPYLVENTWRPSLDAEVEPQYADWMQWSKTTRNLCSWIADGIRSKSDITSTYVPDFDWKLAQRSLGSSRIFDHLVPSSDSSENDISAVNPESEVKRIILGHIDVDESDFNDDAPLTTYGLDSLAAGRLSWALKPFVVLTQFQLLGDISLSDILKQVVLASEAAADGSGPATSSEVTKPQFDWDSLDRKENVVPLVRGEGTPLFLIHGGSGDIIAFMPLQDYFRTPLFGIQATPDTPLHSISETAALYYKKIKEAQPAGPYRLSGYSGTCLITVEIANLLRKNGDEIQQFALIDFWPTIFASPLCDPDEQSYNNRVASQDICANMFALVCGALEREPRPQRKQAGKELWEVFQGRTPSDSIRVYYDTTLELVHSSVRHVIDLSGGDFRNYRSGLDAWLKQSLAGLKVDLYIASDGVKVSFAQAGEQWKNFGYQETDGLDVKIITTQGGHFEIFESGVFLTHLEHGWREGLQH